MAHFYGTVKGSGGTASRCGSKASSLISMTASYEGAVKVILHYDPATNQDFAHVELVPWLGSGVNKVLYSGPVGGPTDRKDAAS